MNDILAEVNRQKGMDLRQYRQDMLQRRVLDRMARIQTDDPEIYLKILQSNPLECQALINHIGVNVSSFFRDPIVFEIIEQSLLPPIMIQKRRSTHKEIRIWSIGCAAGEEAFSLAILIHRAVENEKNDWKSYIFATDIDTDALEAAAKGVYPRESFASTKLEILDKYFIREGNGYQVCPAIKTMVHFSREDCASSKILAPADSVFGSFDLVLCRNLLIYFSKECQKSVFEKLFNVLVPNGFLILGDSEILGSEIESRFKTIDSRNRIFQKTG
jgi:chemotaxis methyl-accepting protein methylase